MSHDLHIDRILDDIRRVEPNSVALAETTRDRVMALIEHEDMRAFHRHLFAQTMAFAIAFGTDHSDPEAAYQATLAISLDVVATIQAVNRRLQKIPPDDAPAALALCAFDRADQVRTTRQEMITSLVEQFHPQAA